MIVALKGKAGSGKSTVGEIINEIMRPYTYVVRMAFSDLVYEIAGHIQFTCDKPPVKDRALLIAVGQGLKTVYGDDHWARLTAARLRPGALNVITDMRFLVEEQVLYEAAQKMGMSLFVVHIYRPCVAEDPTFSRHVSETEMNNIRSSVSIINNGTMDDLRDDVKKMFVELGELTRRCTTHLRYCTDVNRDVFRRVVSAAAGTSITTTDPDVSAINTSDVIGASNQHAPDVVHEAI